MLPLPCMLVCPFVCANRTRDRGCSKHPVFPAPSDFEGGKFQTSGETRREIAKSYLRRMGGAQRYPSPHAPALMGIAALHPSYRSHVVASEAQGRSPDERDIRDHSRTVPDIAALIRATKLRQTATLPPAHAIETAANPAAGKARVSSPSIFPVRRCPSPPRARRARPAPAVGALPL